MKKRFIINFLYVVLSIIVIYGYVEAATEVLSNKYATLSECTSDKDKYNIQFPDYVRSTCFAKDGGHYYTICQKGETCNTPVTTQSNQTLAVENIGGENPFAKSIPPSIKIKMDAIVSALETKQKQTGGAEMEIYLNNFLSKLGTLRSKYAGKKAVEDILGYLEVETKRIKEGNSLNDFLCDLTGDCNDGKTDTSSTTGNTNTGTIINMCPLYSMASHPIGCKYVDGEKDVNGCTRPRLVCVNTGSTNTGTTIPLTCLTRPSYLSNNNANFVNGTPTTLVQQTWQNSSISLPCYYSCKTGYSGTQCTSTSNGSGTTGTDTTYLGCTRNGTVYIHGDVRCNGNSQVRCDDGSFKQIYTCSTGNICLENPERTSGGNFYTSCKQEYQIFYTYGGNGSIYGSVDQSETSTLKELAQYKCKYNTVTGKYGNCIYQSCMSQAHQEGSNCISNHRDCTIVNTTNGGNQTWSNGVWGTCQATSTTACATGYRMIDGVCKMGAETCNSTNILTSNGIDFSNRTYNGYSGGGVWIYDLALTEACTWKCREGYKRASEISGWRGSEYCVKKNICDDDEYFNTAWTSADHANQACHSCKGTAPYAGSSSSTIYTSSTSRGDYTNMIERIAGENQTWKYIATATTSALAESCTWSCKSGYIPGYVQAPQTSRGPLTCCNPSDSTCKPAICTSGVCEWGIMTVRFGNISYPEIEVLKGEALGTTLPTPTRIGFVFAGWYTSSALTGIPVTSTTPIMNSMFLYPKWITQP